MIVVVGCHGQMGKPISPVPSTRARHGAGGGRRWVPAGLTISAKTSDRWSVLGATSASPSRRRPRVRYRRCDALIDVSMEQCLRDARSRRRARKTPRHGQHRVLTQVSSRASEAGAHHIPVIFKCTQHVKMVNVMLTGGNGSAGARGRSAISRSSTNTIATSCGRAWQHSRHHRQHDRQAERHDPSTTGRVRARRTRSRKPAGQRWASIRAPATSPATISVFRGHGRALETHYADSDDCFARGAVDRRVPRKQARRRVPHPKRCST